MKDKTIQESGKMMKKKMQLYDKNYFGRDNMEKHMKEERESEKEEKDQDHV